MMTSFDLSPSQLATFTRWLDEQGKQYARDDAATIAEAERAEYATRCYEKLCAIAKDTARRTGRVEVIHPVHLARAAWITFTENGSYHSTYDVDERWQPSGDDAETWEIVFAYELERMDREARTK